MKTVALLCPIVLPVGQAFFSSAQPQGAFKEGCGLRIQPTSGRRLRPAGFRCSCSGPKREKRTFRLTVTDSRQFVSKVEPTEFMLGPDQSVTVRVELKVPAGTSQGVGDDLVVVAASIAGPATSNSSVAHFSVTAPASSR